MAYFDKEKGLVLSDEDKEIMQGKMRLEYDWIETIVQGRPVKRVYKTGNQQSYNYDKNQF